MRAVETSVFNPSISEHLSVVTVLHAAAARSNAKNPYLGDAEEIGLLFQVCHSCGMPVITSTAENYRC
jgi:hypothetical protein